MPDTTTQQPMKLEASSESFEDLIRIIEAVFGSNALYFSFSNIHGFTVTGDSLLPGRDPIPIPRWIAVDIGDDTALEVSRRIKGVFEELTLERKRIINPHGPIFHLGPNMMGWSARADLIGESIILRVVPA